MRTKFRVLLLFGLAVLSGAAAAREEEPARLDPKRIINRSMGFLKEREPELTAEENALHEKAVKMQVTEPDFALKLLEGLVAKPDDKEAASPAFELLLGNIYYLGGQADRAEARYRNAAERYPSFLRAWTNLGTLYYAQARFAEAVSCLAKAIALGDRESTTFGMMGLCLEQSGDAVGAEVAFVQALAGDPGNVGWMEGLVRVFMQAKQHARAEVMVRSLIKERPTDSRYWLDLAHIMVATDRRLEAIALLEQTLATGIAGEDELTELAGLYADENLLPEAMRTYEKTKVSAQTLGERKTIQLVRALTAGSAWQQAETLLDELGRTGVADRKAFLQARADLLAAQKKWAAARQELTQLLELDPMNGVALVGLGRTHLAEADEVRATLAFEAAAQTGEGAYQASLALANLALKHRHYEQSVAHLEKALSLERNQDVADILARVRSLTPNPEQT